MAFSTLTNPKTILSLSPNRSILGTIIRPDSILLEQKGGVNGGITFESLPPEAGEPVQLQLYDEREVVGNWQFVESKSRKEKFLKKSQKSHKNAGGDEEHEVIGNWQFPRDNLIFEEDNAHSSKKRMKFMKEKQTSLATEIYLVESKPKEEKDLKKHQKRYKNVRGDGEVLQTNDKGSKPRKEKGLKKGRKGHKNAGAGS